MTNKKRLIRIEYYRAVNGMTENDVYQLHEISYFATKRNDLKRACNDHYRKDKNKSILMIYRIDDNKGEILQIRHLSKKPLITI